MPLATLPYTWQIVTVTPDGAGTGSIVTLDILDSLGISVKRTAVVNIPFHSGTFEIVRACEEEVSRLMVEDAGGDNSKLLEALKSTKFKMGGGIL